MKTAEPVKSPLKYFGGKHYLASKIRATFPPHLSYIEPYCGGLSVLLSSDGEGVSEVVNDIDDDLTEFWLCLRREDTYREFKRIVEAMPFSEVEWHDAVWAKSYGDLTFAERAVAFFVRCRQSLAGRMEDFAPISKSRTRRGMNEQVSAWIAAVDGLDTVYARLRKVLILQRDALDVIRFFDRPDCLHYIDAPYLHETRTSKSVYRFEMTEDQHRELLETVVASQAMIAMSGYPSELYESALRGWHRTEFSIANHSSGEATKRRMTEVLWTNYEPKLP